MDVRYYLHPYKPRIYLSCGWPAGMDWHSHKVLSFRLSNTLDALFCVGALKEALDRYGPPQIFNTVQDAQFTSNEFTQTLKAHSIAISMDDRGRAIDNFESGCQFRNGLLQWFEFYNGRRFHQRLNDMTSDEVYYGVSHPLSWAA